MRFLHWIGYKLNVFSIALFGPPRLDNEHDPIVQLKQEHGDPIPDDPT